MPAPDPAVRHRPPERASRRAGFRNIAVAALGATGLLLALYHRGTGQDRGTSAASSLPGLTAEERSGRLVVTSVQDDGAAARAGVLPGDVIVSVSGKPVHDRAEASSEIARSSRPIVDVVILHGKETHQLYLDRPERQR